MADVSQLEVNGTTYNICDATARDSLSHVLELVYPIGSVYINASDSTDPATLLGFGTWVRVGQGRVMIDADSTYEAEATGGSSTHTHATGDCTLTAAQSGVPAHLHSVPAHGHGNNISFSVNSSGAVTNGITGGSHKHVENVGQYTHVVGVNNDTYSTATKVSGYYCTTIAASTNYQNTTQYATHTHNLPNHTHTLTKSGSVTDKTAFNSSNNTAANASSAHNHGNTGSGSTIQPWVGVYMWKRTA